MSIPYFCQIPTKLFVKFVYLCAARKFSSFNDQFMIRIMAMLLNKLVLVITGASNKFCINCFFCPPRFCTLKRLYSNNVDEMRVKEWLSKLDKLHSDREAKLNIWILRLSHKHKGLIHKSLNMNWYRYCVTTKLAKKVVPYLRFVMSRQLLSASLRAPIRCNGLKASLPTYLRWKDCRYVVATTLAGLA